MVAHETSTHKGYASLREDYIQFMKDTNRSPLEEPKKIRLVLQKRFVLLPKEYLQVLREAIEAARARTVSGDSEWHNNNHIAQYGR
jgi:hypothetical protein